MVLLATHCKRFMRKPLEHNGRSVVKWRILSTKGSSPETVGLKKEVIVSSLARSGWAGGQLDTRHGRRVAWRLKCEQACHITKRPFP